MKYMILRVDPLGGHFDMTGTYDLSIFNSVKLKSILKENKN